ncbi:MAG: cytochrome c peroxidase [Bradymonadia bacterium]|jgi:cytochrome c peroxidase
MKRLAYFVAIGLVAGCGDDPASTGWTWELPGGFPEPVVPDDNPMSDAKIELGRFLFYDTRLSLNETQSCGSCHLQEFAFSDGLPQGIGSTGEVHPRGAMALMNVGYNSRQTWANPLIDTLEAQALGPLFGEEPVELGMGGSEAVLVERLAQDEDYAAMFAAAFPEDDGAITIGTITKAVSAFERILISGNAPYDRYVAGDDDAMTESEVRGMRLFFSERLECFHCHGGFNFTDSADHTGLPFPEFQFHNTGLYNLDADGAYPATNQGIFEVTGDPADMGAFRAPSLRNIAVTAPYFHDGTALTLEEAFAHYERGGREITEGENAGDGRDNPLKSTFLTGFIVTDQEREDVLNFLCALTDEEFLTNPAISDPFAE